ncbi:MAG: glutamate racemase [Bacteroidetes bacterium GWA2_31_9]|nr:MAG: glutamate racemase [Bacteroidetes bacterium GWA2_31_9]
MTLEDKSKNRPIGIFDSGVGGLSVLKEIIKLLPNENIIYFADNANCPYGKKSCDEIIVLSDKIVRFLIKKNVKIIVVACNTATAASIQYLRNKYNSISFVGMEPAVKPAAINSKSGKIGILATKGTLEGRLFKETSKKFASDKDVIIRIGDGLVELVEAGKSDSTESFELLKQYLLPMLESGIDQLVLGCTHYPFLINNIKKIVGSSINIIDPAFPVAKRLKDLLQEGNLLNSKNEKIIYNFYSSGNVNIMESMVNGFNMNNCYLNFEKLIN